MAKVYKKQCKPGESLSEIRVSDLQLGCLSSIAISDKGWTDAELGYEFLVDFDTQTNEKLTDGKFCLLLISKKFLCSGESGELGALGA